MTDLESKTETQSEKPGDSATPAAEPKSELLHRKVRDLGLTIQGTPLQKHVDELYAELDAKGVKYRPPVYLSDEWGCPDGVPIIGIPFYLAKPELAKLELELTEDLEDDKRIAMYLRHEAGHAFNYAYALYRSGEWTELFGSFSRPYFEDYAPAPHSRQFVKHLPGWYAQMHPEEDFAETFAVWLTPNLNWRERFAGSGALKKLEYVERAAAEWGTKEPLIAPKAPEGDDLDVRLDDYYARRSSAKPVDRIGQFLDGDIKSCFREGDGVPAAEMLKKTRSEIAHAVSDMTGARYEIVRTLLVFLTQRAEALNLKTDPATSPLAVARVTALATSLAFNYTRTGDFLGIPAQESREEKRP